MEARKQAAAAAVAATQALEEAQATPLPPVNQVPWGNNQNGGTFCKELFIYIIYNIIY